MLFSLNISTLFSSEVQILANVRRKSPPPRKLPPFPHCSPFLRNETSKSYHNSFAISIFRCAVLFNFKRLLPRSLIILICFKLQCFSPFFVFLLRNAKLWEKKTTTWISEMKVVIFFYS